MIIFPFLNLFYCIYFSDLPDMTDEYIDLSVYALKTGLLYLAHSRFALHPYNSFTVRMFLDATLLLFVAD